MRATGPFLCNVLRGALARVLAKTNILSRRPIPLRLRAATRKHVAVMSDRRTARAPTRRKTPTPQPLSITNTSTGRRTATRSASRDVETDPKPIHRNTRQASVSSFGDKSEHKDKYAPRSKKKASAKAARLTNIEEVDLMPDKRPTTPPVTDIDFPFRSPAAVSEISGTTAITSFTMLEAEMLEPRFMLKDLPTLHQFSEIFINHLVPDDGDMVADLEHMQDMLKPDSAFVQDYNHIDSYFSLCVGSYCVDNQQYIRTRPVRTALFGRNHDAEAIQSGVDLVLYLANLVSLAKQMIHSHRTDKDMLRVIRELDNFFPTYFLPRLVPEIDPRESPAGESALVHETFDLALELRTQLAILYLEQRDVSVDEFDPDAVLTEVFFAPNPNATGSPDPPAVRGWNVSNLGGEGSPLSEEFEKRVLDQVAFIKQYFIDGPGHQETGDLVDMEELTAHLPWDTLVLRLLGWARERHQEIRMAIEQLGGVAGILKNISVIMDQDNDGPHRAPSVQPLSPRRKRTSFGRDRRRSGKKFNPNAAVNIEVANKIEAKARDSGIGVDQTSFQSQAQVGEPEQAPLDSPPESPFQNPPRSPPRSPPQSLRSLPQSPPQEVDDWELPQILDSPKPRNEDQVIEEIPEPLPEASQPPRSTNEVFQILVNSKKTDKENHGIFARQANAQRVEFGDPLAESQSTLGPTFTSTQAQKRRRPDEEEDEDDDDDEAFQPAPRTANVQSRRAHAKRVRIEPDSSGAPSGHQRSQTEPSSSGVPPSHQPLQSYDNDEYQFEDDVQDQPIQDQPQALNFRMQKQLAYENRNAPPIPSQRHRKARTAWTEVEEEAFLRYMEEYPQKYARILEVDSANGGILQHRTQVNLKDKARSMAVVMVKYGFSYDYKGVQADINRSRAGLSPGFQNVITPAMARSLVEAGYAW